MDRFDGYAIDTYVGRFSGTFDIEENQGRGLRFGDEVILLVTARIGRATADENALGDMKLARTLKAGFVKFIDPEDASETLTSLGIPHQLSLIDRKSTTPAPTAGLPAGTQVTPTAAEIETDGAIGFEEEEEPDAQAFLDEEDEGDLDTYFENIAPPLVVQEDSPTIVGRVTPKDPALRKFLQELPA